MTAPALIIDPDPKHEVQRRFLRTSVAAVFLIFFQTYMIAPLIPLLARDWQVDREQVGLLLPAYTIPYGVAGLICGLISDRFGRRALLFVGLAAFPLAGIAPAFAPTFRWLFWLRVVSGISNSSVVVIGLSLIGDLFPVKERGRAIGWIFGAVAGGCAFGSTLGAILTQWIGWRGLFILVATAGAGVFLYSLKLWSKLRETSTERARLSVSAVFAGYRELLRSRRGAQTYSYIYLNAVFHSGVFTWLGVFLFDRFHLSEAGIGLALLGYGVPGLLLGPAIGRVVDRYGRRWLIPGGFLVAAGTALLLVPTWPLAIATGAITLLSLGFDMTHPLLAGIVTTLNDRRRGQAMGLNTFSIFLGLGCGSYLFGLLAQHGMTLALLSFAAVQALLGTAAFRLFRRE